MDPQGLWAIERVRETCVEESWAEVPFPHCRSKRKSPGDSDFSLDKAPLEDYYDTKKLLKGSGRRGRSESLSLAYLGQASLEKAR